MKGAGQVSNQNLLPIEQMAIGGYGSVRGHDTSLYLGDKGFTLSGELIFAPPYLGDKMFLEQRIKQMVQFALFYDYGRVYLTDPGLGEYNDERLKGYGGGLRLYYKDIFSFKFDVARPTKKKAEGEDSTVFYFLGNINLTSENWPELLRKIGLWGGDDELED
jgi:hemolysin activation/secretion protein